MSAAGLVSKTFSRWSDHEGQRLGAALAFYSILSAAPLLIFLLLLASMFYGQQTVADKIVEVAQSVMGQTGANVARNILEHAHQTRHGTLAGILGLITLLFGASGAFNELHDDLNKMWDAHPPKKGVMGMIAQRAFSFVLVIGAGVLLFASIVATTTLQVITKFFSSAVPVPPLLLDAANFVVSFGVLTVVFVLIYRFVPDCVLPWKVLWTGAAVSALLFVIGKIILGAYLSKAGVGSAYGAAGSLIAIAFWIYYSAQIFFLGAEFTYVWSARAEAGKPKALAT
jgi:membrane protein